MTIVVVEDNPDLLDLWLELLGLLHRAAEGFPTAEEALRYLRRHGAELVLCDLGLPDMAGADFVTRLRELLPETPILAVSGSDRLHDRVLDAGASEFALKPLRLSELRQRLDRNLRRAV